MEFLEGESAKFPEGKVLEWSEHLLTRSYISIDAVFLADSEQENYMP